MSILMSMAALLFVLPGVPAQGKDESPPSGYLRHDYMEAAAVAHVDVRKAEVVGRVGGYENWRITCLVVESFKGGLKAGAELEYFHGAEAGLRPERLMGGKIVFLLSEYGGTRVADAYVVLENSTLPYTRDTVRKLRRIQRTARRRRPLSGAKPDAPARPVHRE